MVGLYLVFSVFPYFHTLALVKRLARLLNVLTAENSARAFSGQGSTRDESRSLSGDDAEPLDQGYFGAIGGS